ncbi:MAG: PAS domain S-box protein [Streptosporangiales bacterium]|nr:PAS domain S-box protein [Streptosporangiales bacterium]
MAHAALASAADAIVAFDAESRVVAWNPAAERMFGWSAESVLGTSPRMIPEELAAEHHAVLERVRTGGPVSIATRRLRNDGKAIDVRADTSALRSESAAAGGSPEEDGTDPAGWVTVFHPVAREEAAHHHMAERARVVRRLNDVVADINADLDLPAVLDRIAASLTELTGADAGGFVLIEDDHLRLVSLTGLPESLRGRVADLPSSLVGELLRSRKTVMMASGDTRSFSDLIWSELDGLHTIALGVSNVQGRPYGALYALYSQRQVGHIELELIELLAGQAGVALANAMAYQEVVRQRVHERAVIDASSDGIAVLDAQGRVRKWNPAATELTEFTAADVLGKPPPFPIPGPGAPVTHQLDNGRWLEVLSAEIAETDERVVDFRDVTAAKALEEAKDLFLATASHELRTPITVVQGFASTLVQRWDKIDEPGRRAAVQTIAERAGALGRLVENLLLGSRAGTGGLTVNNGPFDLGKLLRGVTLPFQTFSELHTLFVDIPEDMPQAYGDVVATDIIVGQLLENAFKYSPEGGVITVRAQVEDEQVALFVEDEGIGIAPGDHERIFERFVQGEAGDRRRFGGIGLGLYIVQRLAAAQGGAVTARSREPSGTCMRFVLRIAPA